MMRENGGTGYKASVYSEAYRSVLGETLNMNIRGVEAYGIQEYSINKVDNRRVVFECIEMEAVFGIFGIQRGELFGPEDAAQGRSKDRLARGHNAPVLCGGTRGVQEDFLRLRSSQLTIASASVSRIFMTLFSSQKAAGYCSWPVGRGS
ncbi:MAG: hypothetical protein MZV49_09315 [Rhodopseudomonas palustris]|nr:hypothetical protein [Rhodopseudomonas palustris]